MKLRPIAVWRISASPGPGARAGTSSHDSFSGPPTSCTTIAFGMAEDLARAEAGSHPEEVAQALDEGGRAAGAAGHDEDRVVARERAEDVGQVRVVEGARDGRGGARLRAHDDHEAVRLDGLGEAAHWLDGQAARVVVDDVARARGARAAPHAERREIARERRLRSADAARAKQSLQLVLARHGAA